MLFSGNLDMVTPIMRRGLPSPMTIPLPGGWQRLFLGWIVILAFVTSGLLLARSATASDLGKSKPPAPLVMILRYPKSEKGRDIPGQIWARMMASPDQRAAQVAQSDQEPLRYDWSQMAARSKVPLGVTSGIVWDPAGHIVTSYPSLGAPMEHEYFAGWIDPNNGNWTFVAAELLAADPYTDLAVLKASLPPFPQLTFASQQDLVLQQPLEFHIGELNRDFTLSWKQGTGTITSLHHYPPRKDDGAVPVSEALDRYGYHLEVTTDTAWSLAGGALLDSEGHLVGMTLAPLEAASTVTSSCLAMPVDATFRRVVKSLSDGELPAFGFLGIQLDEHPPANRTGTRIKTVVRGMPGDLAGLRDGDWLLQMNDRPIENREALFRELSRYAADSTLLLRVQRATQPSNQQEQLDLSVRLSKKFIATRRPAYSIQPAPSWRGMRVEYSTALPPEMLRTSIRVQGGMAPGVIAVISVEPNTPAWRAGIRVGQILTSVNSMNVQSPTEFYESVQGKPNQAVPLQVISHLERLESLVVGVE